ncbi:uncharacterized protein LOC108682211 [Hyalella azteca]|uniref:Uncharacterized protein LOC108682211 n=1 Tax=Hyalella azteca TaxID=294128 RepID=A0A8B7PLG2_HYAAZ|nr:uncharacterized protein LOC108682211 [Hyalella azteca]
MDALPVLSQTKSVVQWVCRDPEGAKRTQVNFSRQCPVVSQIRSAVEVAKGDTQAARETQKEFGKFIGSLVDGVPVAGHLKGAFHYAMKDKEKGDAAMKAASHTTAVIGGGVGGFLLGGPVGAVAGGIGAGAFMDSTITAVDTGMHSKFLPYGILEPLSDPKNPGKWCDAVGGVMIDGATGHFAGKIVNVIQVKSMAKCTLTAGEAVQSTISGNALSTTTRKIIDEIVIACKSDRGRLILKRGKKFLIEKIQQRLSSFTRYDVTSVEMNNSEKYRVDSACLQETLNRHLNMTFNQNGDVIEIHFEGKLILFKKGALQYLINEQGAMEEIQDGVLYGLQKDGRWIQQNYRRENNDNFLSLVPQEPEDFHLCVNESNSTTGMRIMEWFDGADDLFNFSSPDETQQKVSMVGREEFDLVDEESLSCNFSVTELEND